MYVYADFIDDYIRYFACQRKWISLIRIFFRFSVLLMLLYWQLDISSMQSPKRTNSSTSSASSQPIVGEPSSQGHSAQTAASSTRSRRSRTQTKWPENKLIATGLDANFKPTPVSVRDRFILVCGLIARERVSINKAVDDLSPIENDHLFTQL
jgi:hypothetical protein